MPPLHASTRVPGCGEGLSWRSIELGGDFDYLEPRVSAYLLGEIGNVLGD